MLVTATSAARWEADAVAQAGHAHQEAGRGADDREHDRTVPGVVGDDHDRGPNQGWDRVEPPAQDGGDLAHEDVAQHAAADAGDRAEDHGVDDTEAMGQRGGRSGDAEQRQAGGIERRRSDAGGG